MLWLPLVFSIALVGMFVFDGDVGILSKFVLLLVLTGSIAIRFYDPALIPVGAVVQAVLCIILVFRLKLASQ